MKISEKTNEFINLRLSVTTVYGPYGNTGCGVFKPRMQNWKYFCVRINIPHGNYGLLTFGLMASCQK